MALRPLGLGLPEFVCMRILDDDPGRTSAELARHTHVTAQAMNQVLQGLQDMGLVTRPATAPSGRALPAQLTRKGGALLKRAEAASARPTSRCWPTSAPPSGASSNDCSTVPETRRPTTIRMRAPAKLRVRQK